MDLFEAIRKNNSYVVFELINNGIDVGKVSDDQRYTPLMLACHLKKTNIALALIATGKSNPNYCKYGKFALKIACENLLYKVVLALVESDESDIGQIEDLSHRTALLSISYHKSLLKATKIARVLINSGSAKPEYFTQDYFTPLIGACLGGSSEIALKLLATGKSNPSITSTYGYTALLCACYKGLHDVALALIDTGLSNPEIVFCDNFHYFGVKTPHKTYTAFSLACDNNMKKVALRLVEIGVVTIEELMQVKPEWVYENFQLKLINIADIDI